MVIRPDVHREKLTGGDKMKALKVFMAILIAMAVIMPLTVNQSQAAVWANCFVNQVGGNTGTTGYVMLTDSAAVPTFQNTWFALPAATYTVFTATLLTAMASGQKVRAQVQGVGGGNLMTLYLMDQ
jgi:hypothetical protein